jgi:hypothetical protein
MAPIKETYWMRIKYGTCCGSEPGEVETNLLLEPLPGFKSLKQRAKLYEPGLLEVIIPMAVAYVLGLMMLLRWTSEIGFEILYPFLNFFTLVPVPICALRLSKELEKLCAWWHVRSFEVAARKRTWTGEA